MTQILRAPVLLPGLATGIGSLPHTDAQAAAEVVLRCLPEFPAAPRGRSSLSRISASFAAAPGRTGLIPFITAGYPSLDASLEMLRGFARLGARAVEIGIPFTDPIADGLVIAAHSLCVALDGD